MRFAVIGCGNIARKYSIPALIHSGVSSVSVCVDINPLRKQQIQELFSLPFESSLDEAFIRYDFDAVHISIPESAST